jgi:hypothetical protein
VDDKKIKTMKAVKYNGIIWLINGYDLYQIEGSTIERFEGGVHYYMRVYNIVKDLQAIEESESIIKRFLEAEAIALIKPQLRRSVQLNKF